MSYILDALRKADAERETGAVPDLHAQQYITMPADDDGARRTGWLIALAGLLGAALIGVLAWALLWRNAPHALDTTAVAAAPIMPTPGTPAPATPLVHAGAPGTVASPTALAPSTALPRATSPSAKPVPAADATTTAASRKRVAAPAVSRAEPGLVDGSPPPAGANTAKRAATDGADRIYTVAELPEAVRKDLPPISVNGSSYSSDASSRLLIVNGQVLREGDKVSGDVRLEKIRQRSAVLSVKGYRYEIMY